jgi:phosphoribosylamine---glycine ligase
MKILVLGSGGREHAISDTLHRQGHSVYCLPGNGGTISLSQPVPKIDSFDFPALIDWVKKEKIELTVVGPEIYLEKGIADIFHKHHLKLFGPNRQAAQLESSKAFAKQFMAKHHIPTAEFIICANLKEAQAAIEKNFDSWKGVVIKPDGLTGGKGVHCCKTMEEAFAAARELLQEKRYGNSGSRVVIERLLPGTELSQLVFCDGKTMIPMIPVQDYKRLLNGNEGPNTGGVGAYSSPSFVTPLLIRQLHIQVIEPTLKALQEEKIHYCGVLYFGLMLTAEGPKVLEFNCRFGDPETQALMPLVDFDLAQAFLACCEGKLHKSLITWKPLHSCCVVMTSEGYPEQPKTGYPIHGLDSLRKSEEIRIYHAGTKYEAGKLVTNGGRVLAITATDKTIQGAMLKAYETVDQIQFQGAHYRQDIAGGLLATQEA